jgi:glycosyltransferase involved in cell wall biosynthesis
MEIHQVIVAAAPGDAVTNTALEYRRLLRRVGPSEIYAAHRDPSLTDDVLPLSAYASRASARAGHDVLVVHLSIGDVTVDRFVAERAERIVLVYHNVTPPEYFAPYDPSFARLLHQGRIALARLTERADLAIAVSRYNATELEALGYREVRVVPLVVDVDEFRAVEPDTLMSERLAALDGPTFLYVGQILPHKRPDLLLEAYHVLVTTLLPEANLVIAGHARNAGYARAFRGQLAELSLPNARFLRGVSDAELVACFEQATAFVTASEHEGVCVPLLEAMSFDRPVVARDYGAIAETMGDAGLLLPSGSGAILLAEALAEIAGSAPLRDDLVARGRRRLAAFDPDAARTAFLDAMLEVA